METTYKVYSQAQRLARKKENKDISEYMEHQIPALKESVAATYRQIENKIPEDTAFSLRYLVDEKAKDSQMRDLFFLVTELRDILNTSYVATYEAKAAGALPPAPAGYTRITSFGYSVDVKCSFALDAIDQKKIIAAVQDPGQRHKSADCTGQPAHNKWWYVHDYGRNRLLLVDEFDDSTNPRRVTITKNGSVNAGTHNFT